MQLASIRTGFAALLLGACGLAFAKDAHPRADFLFVGSYHMGNPGRDVHNTKADDVLGDRRQREIKDVVRLVERYRPTKIMIEANTSKQAEINGKFEDSCRAARALTRNEIEQLGFRIACDMNLDGVVAVDWGGLGPIKDEDSIDYPKSVERHGQQQQYQTHLDIGAKVNDQDQHVLDHGTVLDMLKRLNSSEWLESNGRAYFRIGLLGTPEDPAGANWVQLWFGRNLAIFNNIVRNTKDGDRVLVIYGAGHGNHLRQLARDSGMYRVHDPLKWLSDAKH